MTFPMPDHPEKQAQAQMLIPMSPAGLIEMLRRAWDVRRRIQVARQIVEEEASTGVPAPHPWRGKRAPVAAKPLSEERLEAWMVPRDDTHATLLPPPGYVYRSAALARADRIRRGLFWGLGLFAVLGVAALFLGPLLVAVGISAP